MAIAILSLTTTVVKATPSTNDDFGPAGISTDSGTAPLMGLRRRQLFLHRRDFDFADFSSRQDAVRRKEAAAAAAAATQSDSAPAPQTVAAEPAPAPPPAQTA
ncbi:hypothetical protein BGZ96_010740 [Linnemannia gamsii]|uniref:Uncharacterized protein n=1 Tax=Linnemannia gamsii TaxID=64522 RepID=A0ABQ7JU34_9FUNG|nr:hypothetical protein BGZ96_010740 [Linnemannia gamsii]